MCVPVEQVWVAWCARGGGLQPRTSVTTTQVPSQDDGELFVEPSFPSEELLDALQQDLSDK